MKEKYPGSQQHPKGLPLIDTTEASRPVDDDDVDTPLATSPRNTQEKKDRCKQYEIY
ncbi:hypothetical protein [Geomonas agri]|uniref:hypothetical protein n=1 Tax=Geomonas agri TaxID=2873702 RepID=UPI001CD7EFD7|nr:hypothetical protein [Geomonas agri]